MSVSQNNPEINLNLHAKQGVAFNSKATEILYGGAAGGGKSFLMRVAAIIWCAMIPGLQVYIFRRIYDDLIKNHIEGPSGFRSLLAPWEALGFVKIVDDEIRFWNDSKIYLCHCQHEKDRFKYQGAEIHVLIIDELTHFTDTIYRFLRNRVRMVGIKLPKQYEGSFPRILCGSNPGNIGHVWVKASFIDNCQPLQIRKMSDTEGGMLRQYIPAKLEDNPSMEREDPNYRLRLRGLGSPALVKAMENGDWDVIEGAYFDCWDSKLHVIRPFQIPKHWLRFRSGDWGSARPFSFGWNAVASENFLTPDKVWIPKGAIVRFKEWYGCAIDKDGNKVPNKGLKLFAEAVGKGIRERDGTEEMDYSVLDPACFAEDGGPSIASRLDCDFEPADNSRVAGRGAMGGWDQVRSRLVGEDFGEPMGHRPMLYFFSTCEDSIRTIPALQHDPNRLEDIDSKMEDHAADDVRYGCMSEPYIKEPEQNSKPKAKDAYGDDEDEDEEEWKTR
jgi:hypothetical protein